MVYVPIHQKKNSEAQLFELYVYNIIYIHYIVDANVLDIGGAHREAHLVPFVY